MLEWFSKKALVLSKPIAIKAVAYASTSAQSKFAKTEALNKLLSRA